MRANLWWFLTTLVYVAWLPVERLGNWIERCLVAAPADRAYPEWGGEWVITPPADEVVFGVILPYDAAPAYAIAPADDTLQFVGWVVVCVLAVLACRPGTARGQFLLGGLTLGFLLAEPMLTTALSWQEMLVHRPFDVLRLVTVLGLVILATRAGLRERDPLPAKVGRRFGRFWRSRSVRVVTVVLALAAILEAAVVFALVAQEGEPVATSPPPSVEHEETPPAVEPIGCNPTPRTPVVRPPKAAATRRVGAAWRRIERWMADKAPRSHRQLNPPASPQAIARAEAAMALTFPDELKASLLRHDGGGFTLWWLYEPIGLDTIVGDWRGRCKITLEGSVAPDEHPRKYVDPEGHWWHGDVVPFTRDGSGNSLVVGRDGRVGEFFHEEGILFGGHAGWRSYAAFLEDVADSLESGEPLRDSPPSVRSGVLEWGYP
ncbi:SMI1/KNR4 family protein [Nonomuraea longicatena]|uniref:Knr4/Smi1-like domain-containing protein n=1 Tax=Nonomuraea longicatena TaxID=83682 RepID=A0ABP4AR97_9ACTN